MTVVLRGITWEHERGHGSIVAASAQHALEHDGVRVEWEARSLQSFADQPLEVLAPRYDLLVIDHPHVAAAAEAGLLLALDEHVTDEVHDGAFVGRSHESYRYRGHQYGLATDAAAQVAAYRADLIGDAPQTWPEVLELADAGRVLWPAKPIDAFSSLVTVLSQHGGEVMADAERFARREAFGPAWELLLALRDRVPEECLTLNPIEVAERLASGERFAYSPLLFGYTNYSRAGYRAAVVNYTDIPVLAPGDEPAGSLLGGAGIAVSASTAHPDEAAAYAVWLATPSIQAGSYFDGGGQPGHREAWESDALDAQTAKFFSATRRTLEGAVVRPRHAKYIDFQDDASILVNRALTERGDADTLADDLDRLYTRVLGDAHAGR